jgi:hypothetical protein
MELKLFFKSITEFTQSDDNKDQLRFCYLKNFSTFKINDKLAQTV